MGVTGISTTVMLAVAAGLWFLYLVPTWLRRREYVSTERTAARLQQTLRVLAETAEVPEVVRVEASAREAARQDRIYRAQQRRADAAAARQAAAIVRSAPSAPVDPALLRRARVRRARLVATLLMATATVIGVVQIGVIATTGAVFGSWVVLGGAVALGGVAIGMRRRVDARAIPQRQQAPVRRASAAPAAAPQRAQRTAWTPTSLPKPLYLDQPAPQPVVPAVDPAVVLRAAAEEAERAQRAARIAAESAPEVVPLRRTAASARLSRMGRIDPQDTAAPDLDEVLRRRRSAG
ncbi:MAG TPA: hypothetical protein VN759_02595 [Pseudolysinimonas sp.]|nr:hypothetical protein [Pseudolysinimonas sp.]